MKSGFLETLNNHLPFFQNGNSGISQQSLRTKLLKHPGVLDKDGFIHLLDVVKAYETPAGEFWAA